MTIIEQIALEAESSPPKDRHELLRYVQTIRAGRNDKTPTAITTQKTLGKARKALRAVKGMWKNRTDLPADTAEASIDLRRRLMRRAKDG